WQRYDRGALRRAQREAGRAGSVQVDLLGSERGDGPLLAAVLTAVMAEMAEVDGVVDVRGAAPPAVLGIRRVLQLWPGKGGVFDPEVADASVEAPAQVGDQRVVRVKEERRRGRKRSGDRGPLLSDRLELPVAVELIAEQIRQEDGAGRQLRDQSLEPELIHLEEPEVCADSAARAGCGEQRRGDA